MVNRHRSEDVICRFTSFPRRPPKQTELFTIIPQLSSGTSYCGRVEENRLHLRPPTECCSDGNISLPRSNQEGST